jgi:hypothetical protein
VKSVFEIKSLNETLPYLLGCMLAHKYYTKVGMTGSDKTIEEHILDTNEGKQLLKLPQMSNTSVGKMNNT